MITTEYDYRIGMITPQGDPNAQVAYAAFKNGMTYYCGLCPKTLYYFDIYGNAMEYPQLVEIPADEKQESLSCLCQSADRQKSCHGLHLPDHCHE